MNALLTPRRPRPHGFTLVELLVSLALASLAILIFYAFIVSTERASRAQTDATRAVERLDVAMSMIKADMRTAGYLGLPAVNLPAANYEGANVMCAEPPAALFGNRAPSAIDVLPVASGDPVLPSAFAGTGARRHGALQLTGAFRVRDPLAIRGSAGSVLEVQPPLEVDLVSADPASQTALYRRLIDGGIAAVSNRMGGVVYVPIAPFTTITVGQLPLANIETALAGLYAEDADAFSEVCRFTGLAPGSTALIDDGMRVAVLHTVRYHVLPRVDVEPPDAQIGAADVAEFVLVRDVVRAGTNPPVVLDRQVVARNVIDFNVSFDGFTGDRTNPTLERALDSADSALLGGNFGADGCALMGCQGDSATAQPERARHAYVLLAVRFDEAIDGLEDFAPSAGLSVRRAVEFGDNDETTRVLVHRAEIPLTNFALASIRPRI